MGEATVHNDGQRTHVARDLFRAGNIVAGKLALIVLDSLSMVLWRMGATAVGWSFRCHVR